MLGLAGHHDWSCQVYSVQVWPARSIAVNVAEGPRPSVPYSRETRVLTKTEQVEMIWASVNKPFPILKGTGAKRGEERGGQKKKKAKRTVLPNLGE